MQSHPSRRMLAGAMLILVLAWAVVAVILLIGTLSAADSIQDDVGKIDSALSSANQDLDYVRLTHRTVYIAKQIADAARPLSGQLTAEIGATDGIDRHAHSIERKVDGINATAHSIERTAGSIERRVISIHGNVASIQTSVRGIDDDVGSVLGHVRATYASVLGINDRFRAVHATARSIDAGIRGINIRVESATGVARDIWTRLRDVLDEVGVGHGTPTDAPIHGHANSIDCQVRGSYCDR